jgi:hypothetical protein
MEIGEIFLYSGLTPLDQVCFARLIQACFASMGGNKCWNASKVKDVSFQGVTSVHPKRVLYKNVDVRPLMLAFANEVQTETQTITVRKACCSSEHCMNPSHYYWGSRTDVAGEVTKRSRPRFDAKLVEEMRKEKENNTSILKISRKYKIPYHTARRICNGETYTGLTTTEEQVDTGEYWNKVMKNCVDVINSNPQASKELKITYHMTKELECPWHRKTSSKHKGNFGAMGECLDCMEEIKNGRCTVDVTNFDFRSYWTVKRFWDYVDIQGEDDCWPWIGPTKKNETESVAYFPSPFHSSKSQSASRVAFWLSRGYVGKYRVFSFQRCKKFCCNPKHLTIRELKDQPIPDKIEVINLSYGNIFDRHRETLAQSQSGTAD